MSDFGYTYLDHEPRGDKGTLFVELSTIAAESGGWAGRAWVEHMLTDAGANALLHSSARLWQDGELRDVVRSAETDLGEIPGPDNPTAKFDIRAGLHAAVTGFNQQVAKAYPAQPGR